MSDHHWLEPAKLQYPAPCASHTLASYYVTSHDGARLAVDVHLPSPLPDKPIPAVLHCTRYFRDWQFHRPSALALGALTLGFGFGSLTNRLKIQGVPGFPGAHWNMRTVLMAEHFLPRGFAWVSVDVRGTGASEGTRPADFHPEEIKDLKCLIEWVTSQAWSNKEIFSTGISYDGMTAIFQATGGHAPVKAIAPQFALVDLYSELSNPGGLHCKGFLAAYSQFCNNLDANTPTNFPYPAGMKVFVGMTDGVMPVTERPGADADPSSWPALKDVVAGHDSYNQFQESRKVMNADDPAPGVGWTISQASPAATLGSLSPTCAVLCVSGWYDSGSAVGAVRMFLTALAKWEANGSDPRTTPRLLLGPWNHGARNNCSPFSQSSVPSFPVPVEIMRFFEAHASHPDGANAWAVQQDEPRVRYFTVGEEAWKSADSWPPAHTPTHFALGGGNALAAVAADGSEAKALSQLVCDGQEGVEADVVGLLEEGQGKHSYRVDYGVTTGTASRWNLVQHIFKVPQLYKERAEQDARLLCFDSAPLDAAMEITGHPVATLWIASDTADAAVFVYLEEVGADGTVRYITEGQLKASHRRVGVAERPLPYEDPLPVRTFFKADLRPLTPGKPAKCVVPMVPVSYRVAKGSRVRVAVAGADSDNFDLFLGDNQPTVLTVLHSPEHGLVSGVTLPVVVQA